MFFTKDQPTHKIWYYDLSDLKICKKTPLMLKHFEELFCLLPIVDTRTLEELMDIIDAKGKEITEALSALRGVTKAGKDW